VSVNNGPVEVRADSGSPDPTPALTARAARYVFAGLLLLAGVALLLLVAWRAGLDSGLVATGCACLGVGALLAYDGRDAVPDGG